MIYFSNIFFSQLCGALLILLYDSRPNSIVNFNNKFVCFKKNYSPFSAITLLAGFMMAESALMGRRIGLLVSFISMMTTCAVSPTFSRTQMNLSDSIVSVLNVIVPVLIPAFESWKGWNTIIYNLISFHKNVKGLQYYIFFLD